MLYILLILIAEAVKPQAVRFGLDERGELCLQCNIVSGSLPEFITSVTFRSVNRIVPDTYRSAGGPGISHLV